MKEIEAVVIKGDLVRVEGLPLVQRIPGMPELDRGRKVLLGVLGFDYIDVLLRASCWQSWTKPTRKRLKRATALKMKVKRPRSHRPIRRPSKMSR